MSGKPIEPTRAQLQAELQLLRQTCDELRDQLDLANATVDAIREGEVDAFVVTRGDQSTVIPLDTEQLRVMADSVPVLLSYIDRSLNYRFVNRLYESWFSLPRHKIAGQHASVVLGQAAFESLLPAFQACLAGEESTVENWVPYRTGKRFISARYIPDKRGDEVEGFFVLVIDQTERERLLASERSFAARIQRLAEVSVRIAAMHDLQTALQLITHEARNLVRAQLAITSLAATQSRQPAFNAVSLADKYAQYTSQAVSSDISQIYEQVCRDNFPRRMTEAQFAAHLAAQGESTSFRGFPPMRGWLAAPMINRAGSHLGLIQLSDKIEGEFTEDDEAILVQLAQMASRVIENAQLYDELRDKDRRKDEFLAMLAHELRNPLAAVRSSLSVTQNPDLAPTDRAAAVEVMERQLVQLTRLIDDLLDVSRITSGKIQLRLAQTDLHEILRRAVETVQPLMDSLNHQLWVHIGRPQQLTLLGDGPRLEQVFVNLLTNAAKYTPAGGTIWFSAQQHDDRLEVKVRDNGIGISADMLSQVFELFSQAQSTLDRSQGGLGIGLTLVKTLVEMHQGSVTVHSLGEGQGAEFTVTLPAATAPTQAELPPPRKSQLKRPIRKILVVDDNVDAARMLSMLLRAYGQEVECVHNGNDGLAKLADFPAEIALLDIGLPGMDGYQVAREIRKNFASRVPLLVAVSGYGQAEDRARSKAAGFAFHLVKPVEITELLQVMSTIDRSPT